MHTILQWSATDMLPLAAQAKRLTGGRISCAGLNNATQPAYSLHVQAYFSPLITELKTMYQSNRRVVSVLPGIWAIAMSSRFTQIFPSGRHSMECECQHYSCRLNFTNAKTRLFSYYSHDFSEAFVSADFLNMHIMTGSGLLLQRKLFNMSNIHGLYPLDNISLYCLMCFSTHLTFCLIFWTKSEKLLLSDWSYAYVGQHTKQLSMIAALCIRFIASKKAFQMWNILISSTGPYQNFLASPLPSLISHTFSFQICKDVFYRVYIKCNLYIVHFYAHFYFYFNTLLAWWYYMVRSMCATRSPASSQKLYLEMAFRLVFFLIPRIYIPRLNLASTLPWTHANSKRHCNSWRQQ